jgi:hypothetical protein
MSARSFGSIVAPPIMGIPIVSPIIWWHISIIGN